MNVCRAVWGLPGDAEDERSYGQAMAAVVWGAGGGRRGKFVVILCGDSPRHCVLKSCYKIRYDAVNAVIRCYLYMFCPISQHNTK